MLDWNFSDHLSSVNLGFKWHRYGLYCELAGAILFSPEKREIKMGIFLFSLLGCGGASIWFIHSLKTQSYVRKVFIRLPTLEEAWVSCSSVLELAPTSSEEPIFRNFAVPGTIESLKWAMVRVFTLWKSANTKNRVLCFVGEPVTNITLVSLISPRPIWPSSSLLS